MGCTTYSEIPWGIRGSGHRHDARSPSRIEFDLSV
jgi:hypothetical protein